MPPESLEEGGGRQLGQEGRSGGFMSILGVVDRLVMSEAGSDGEGEGSGGE